jgi:hypothetical protein
MREEKVKVALLLGEKAVRSHGHPHIFKPGSRRSTSGEPTKT